MTSTKLLIKRSIKSAAAGAISTFGLRRNRPGFVNIVAYHHVVGDIAKVERDSYYGLVVSAATFRRHCELLKTAFNVVSLESAAPIVSGKRRSHRPLAAITFDDGYLDLYDEAFPILKDLGLPATVFLPTDCIGHHTPLAHDRIFWLLKHASERGIPIGPALTRAAVPGNTSRLFAKAKYMPALSELLVYLPHIVRERAIAEMEKELPNIRPYPDEYRLLNWDQVREMAAGGISFGAHTARHLVLTLETRDVARSEITASKQRIASEIDSDATSFAYPNGEFDQTIRQLVAKAGFKIAVTTQKKINRPGTDLLALGRFSLCEESTRGIRGTFSADVANLRLNT